MRRVARYELCSSCSNMMYGVSTIGNCLEGKGYSNPLGYMMINLSILQVLQEKGGCSKCINLFKQASNQ